ncbi:MAG: hypothetical protein AB1671_08980 [Thermodesulfobacteriota bacterium]
MAEQHDPVAASFLAPPHLTVAPGYTARVLVPPGTLYDPLFPVPGDGEDIWLNDDGGEEGEGGGGLYRVRPDGTVTPLVPVGNMPPPTGIDRAPHSFAPYTGQIFVLAQPKKGWAGATANHVILRVDPQTWAVHRFAELSSAGSRNEGVSGAGIDLLFGPDGTAFAGRLFAVTALNNAIYQITPDGQARPFVVMETARPRQPVCLTFATVNGEGRMLVTTANGNFSPRRLVEGFATVTQITPDGQVLPEFFVEGLQVPSGLAFAPSGFGPYGGDLFIADIAGLVQMPVPKDKPLPRNGRIVRVDTAGTLHVFAEGFAMPLGLRFIHDRLIVCDVNGDYIGGGQELPDGFVVEIRAQASKNIA